MNLPTQSKLFFLENRTSTGAGELFPAVWHASQGLADPSLEIRRSSLSKLEKLEVVRLSPLVAYLVASRLSEPDDNLRQEIVRVVGSVLLPDNLGRSAPEEVRACLTFYFSTIGREIVENLIRVVVLEPELRPSITRILNLCPNGGRLLMDILTDRRHTVETRRQAAELIGLVGFIECRSGLERLLARLQAKQKGQHGMSFAKPESLDESALLPVLQTTLTLLQVE